MVGTEEDGEVNGAPFFVMEFVDGVIARDADRRRPARPCPRGGREPALVDTLLALHATDVEAVGLGDLAAHAATSSASCDGGRGSWRRAASATCRWSM